MFHTILLQAASAVADTTHQAGIVSPSGAEVPTQEVTTPLGLITSGGPFMTILLITLFLFLLIAIFFTIERLIVISRAGKIDRNFSNNIRDYVLNGKIDSARELCRVQNTPVARVIEKGISRLGKPTREISDAMETTGRLEITRAEKNIHFITLIARIAPMLGFIGTIFGVIVIFHDIANSNGDLSIKIISHGLYLKMFSSAAGLAVGVLAFMMYHFLNTMVDNVAKKIERSTLEFLDLINEPGR
ncbi:MAG TPA: MotA/TolQ/ExbB proton channel family protein [Bacteroidia bacterium]|nr:MotA/TolQ/ExbB proton channel family protein [Bacteroidia bacterium]